MITPERLLTLNGLYARLCLERGLPLTAKRGALIAARESQLRLLGMEPGLTLLAKPQEVTEA